MNKRTLGFVIGRFQPYHNGHKYLIENAYENCDTLIVFIGSVQEARTQKNPFTFFERWRMLYDDLNLEYNRNIIFIPLDDKETNEEWIKDIEYEIIQIKKFSYSDHVRFFCCDKDQSTIESNNLLKELDVEICRVEHPHGVNATDIRKMMFNGMEFQIIDFVPHSTLNVIGKTKIIEEFEAKYQYTNE